MPLQNFSDGAATLIMVHSFRFSFNAQSSHDEFKFRFVEDGAVENRWSIASFSNIKVLSLVFNLYGSCFYYHPVVRKIPNPIILATSPPALLNIGAVEVFDAEFVCDKFILYIKLYAS